MNLIVKVRAEGKQDPEGGRKQGWRGPASGQAGGGGRTGNWSEQGCLEEESEGLLSGQPELGALPQSPLHDAGTMAPWSWWHLR